MRKLHRSLYLSFYWLKLFTKYNCTSISLNSDDVFSLTVYNHYGCYDRILPWQKQMHSQPLCNLWPRTLVLSFLINVVWTWRSLEMQLTTEMILLHTFSRTEQLCKHSISVCPNNNHGRNLDQCDADDVIMSTMASQITIFTSVYSTVYSGADQRKHQSSASRHWPLCGEFTGDRWIPRTNVQ